MKPFNIGDKRFAFDVTNADDLRRLERAFALLCERSEQMNAAGGAEMTASAQMQAIFGLYYDFFETVFPARAAEIIGTEPSVAHAGRAFDRFAAYLHGCIAEEERCEQMMRRLYLSETKAENDSASDDSAADVSASDVSAQDGK